MKNYSAVLLAGSLALGSAGTALAADESMMESTGNALSNNLQTENFSATLTYTTNYMYRGISFSKDKGALQGSFDWANDNWFAGVWTSSLADQDGSGYELENDFYAGYYSSYKGFDWYIMPIYYHFTDYNSSNNNGVKADVWEFWFDGTYTINDTWAVHGLYAYSPDFFFESGDANYIKGDVIASLPQGWGISAGWGYQDVEGDNSDFLTGNGWDYSHWDIGLTKSLVGFDFDLRYHDTDADDGDSLINEFVPKQYADEEVVFTISRSF